MWSNLDWDLARDNLGGSLLLLLLDEVDMLAQLDPQEQQLDELPFLTSLYCMPGAE